MLTKTRSEIRAEVLRRARLVDHLNAHPTVDVNIDILDSYRDLRALATNSKWTCFLKTTGSLSLPTTPATNESFVVIPVPTDAIVLKRLETSQNAGQSWDAAEEVPLAQLRGHYDRAFATAHGYLGFRWCELDQGALTTEAANTGSLVAGRIALSPVPSAGTYQLWYLPEAPAVSADSGASGFFVYANQDMVEYHIWHVVAKLLGYDNDAQGMLAAAQAWLGKYEGRILNSAPTAAGPRTWRRSRNYRAR